MRSKSRRSKSQLVAFLSEKADPWTDIGLTLPILLGYHLGVIFMPVRNAADMVTSRLVALSSYSILMYIGLTLAIAAAFVGILVAVGRGKKLVWQRFLVVALEGAVYAALMALIARFVVGSLRLSGGGFFEWLFQHKFFAGVVMSLGAGFYEEVVFRVGLFGLGLMLLVKLLRVHPTWLLVIWALVTAVIFSAWHYVGPFGDPFKMSSFVFRVVCGLVFVAIYRFRGFAPVVWCHALYDVWVLAL